MPGENIDRGDLAGFVIRDDVDNGHAFGCSGEPLTILQRTMLCLRAHRRRSTTNWSGNWSNSSRSTQSCERFSTISTFCWQMLIVLRRAVICAGSSRPARAPIDDDAV